MCQRNVSQNFRWALCSIFCPSGGRTIEFFGPNVGEVGKVHPPVNKWMARARVTQTHLVRPGNTSISEIIRKASIRVTRIMMVNPLQLISQLALIRARPTHSSSWIQTSRPGRSKGVYLTLTYIIPNLTLIQSVKEVDLIRNFHPILMLTEGRPSPRVAWVVTAQHK